MLNGLDLFTGTGGLSMALEPWVRPIAYCENDRHAQAILLSRMRKGELPLAGIWDDVRTLTASHLGKIDLIAGGFPCQDISAAGSGIGMEQGERSGLFFEILRLVTEIRPAFVFLENVMAIRTRGLARILSEFTALRYDCRWTIVSAAEIGAPHLRRRWFLLAADAERRDLWDEQQRGPGRRSRGLSAQGQALAAYDGSEKSLADAPSKRRSKKGQFRSEKSEEWITGGGETLADAAGERGAKGRPRAQVRRRPADAIRNGPCFEPGWWAIEPDVGRVANGIPLRVDRLRGMGNAVVPAQAREAFKRLMGLE